MTPHEIVVEFKRKYEATYLFVQMPDSDESNLFYLRRVMAGGDGNGVMELQSEEFGKIALNINTAHKIKFAFPKVGVFQNGVDACLFHREPRRQWQRGLCDNNSSISPVWMSLDMEGIARRPDYNFTSVANAFAGATYSYAQAVLMLGSGKYRSVALGRGMSLMLSITEAYEYLMLYGLSPIAGIHKSGSIAVLDPAFSSQVTKVTT